MTDNPHPLWRQGRTTVFPGVAGEWVPVELADSVIADLTQQIAELQKDKARLDKLERVMEWYQYRQDIALQTDEEDGVWFARFYRRDTGDIKGTSLDPSDSKTLTVRAAIDVIDSSEIDSAMSQTAKEQGE